jgi:hypothetical protein
MYQEQSNKYYLLLLCSILALGITIITFSTIIICGSKNRKRKMRYSFEEIEEECLRYSFGEIWQSVRYFLHKTEEFYMTDFMVNKHLTVENIETIQDFKALLLKTQISLDSYEGNNFVENKSVKNLQYFIQLQILFVAILSAKAENKDYNKDLQLLNTYIDEHEMSVHWDEDSLFRKLSISEWLGGSMDER